MYDFRGIGSSAKKRLFKGGKSRPFFIRILLPLDYMELIAIFIFD